MERNSNIYQDKRGYYYYQTWTFYDTDGSKKKRVRKSLGKKTPKEIKTLKQEWDNFFNDVDKGGNKGNPFQSPPRPLSKMIGLYQDYMIQRYNDKEISKTTLRFHKENTNLFLNFMVENIGDKLIDKITTQDIINYKNFRMDKGLSPNTISINLRNIRPFFYWCVDEKFIYDNPFTKDVKLPKYKSRPSDEIPMGEDWERLYDFIQKSLTFRPTKEGKWDWWNNNDWFKYHLYIMINTGMRGGEVRILKWNKGENDNPNQPESYSHLSRDMKKICIYFKGTYGEIPLTKNLQDVFKKLKKTKGDNTYVFENDETKEHYQKRYFNRLFLRLCNGLGLVDELQKPLYTPHSIRHGVVSRLISKGVDMFKIQKLLRHSSIRTTLDIYGHLQQDDLTNTMDMLR